MNNAINEIKNTLDGTNGRIMEAEVRISEVEDKMVEINEAERKIEKPMSHQPDSSRKKGRRIKSTKLDMKMEKSQHITQKYKGS